LKIVTYKIHKCFSVFRFVLTPQAAVLKSLNAQSKANSDKIKTIEVYKLKFI